MKKKSAFTLLEIIIAMAVVAALIAVTLLGVQVVQRTSRDNERRTALSAIKNEIEDYYGNNARYPSSLVLTGNNIISIGAGGKQITLNGTSIDNQSLTTAPYADITGTRYCYQVYGNTVYKLGVALESGSFFNLGNDINNTCTSPTGGL